MKTGNIFLDLVRNLAYFDKRLHVYDIKEPLYSSEIHIICIIAENPDIHVTGIAKRMGFSKSAASQMLAKLEKRGMLLKGVSPDKLTKLTFSLTDSGRKVYEFHEELHREFHLRFQAILSDRSEEEQNMLQNFFTDLSRSVNEWKKARAL